VLLDAVADLAITDASDPVGPWDARLVAVLTSIRAAALRHPGIAGRPRYQRPVWPLAGPAPRR
jgi:hypothetical protein